MVMGPHGALDCREIVGHEDESAMFIGSRTARIGRLGVGYVAARHRPAPTAVLERTGEGVAVGGAVALRTVVSVVIVELLLVAAEAIVVRAINRRLVVDTMNDRFAVPRLDQRRRKGRLAGAVADGIGPDGVRLLCREVGVEALVGRELRPRRHVADLGEELVPPLMGKERQAGLGIRR